jgi:hypothetical protein
VTLCLIVVACGGPAPSPSPSQAPSPTATPTPTATASQAPSASASPASSAEVNAALDDIEAQVIEIRGLEPSREVERRFIDEGELRTMITGMVDEETPPEYIAATERFYKAFGLIPADANLRELTLDLLSGGVAGFYRDDQNTLYVVSPSGDLGVNERITFAHEYDHALQDQNTDVFSEQEDVLDQSDRLLARQAVYEGDATLLMTVWSTENFDLADLAELFAISNDPEAAALLERMPAILRETLLFPYTTGLQFVLPIQAQGDWEAVDALYDRMPESTEQILHPEAYEAGEDPVEVAIPEGLAGDLGPGWASAQEDTFGELQLGIWLREAGLPTSQADAAAAGWGGDRLAVLNGPDDTWAVVLETAWDTADDATAFRDAAETAVAGLPQPGSVVETDDDRIRILVASDEATLLKLDVLIGETGV